MPVRIAVVDVALGNLRSVEKAVERAALDAGASADVALVADADELRRFDKVVFPGQGAFRDCSLALSRGVGDAVREHLRAGKPYLGICLGLQALFQASDEAEGMSGLGVFPGRCVKLPGGGVDPGTNAPVKIPHMGWNQIEPRHGGHPLLDAGGGRGAWFYFVHSFHAVPDDASLVVATAQHGPFEVTAAVARDNVFATQFHPEKSQAAGLALLAAFARA